MVLDRGRQMSGHTDRAQWSYPDGHCPDHSPTHLQIARQAICVRRVEYQIYIVTKTGKRRRGECTKYPSTLTIRMSRGVDGANGVNPTTSDQKLPPQESTQSDDSAGEFRNERWRWAEGTLTVLPSKELRGSSSRRAASKRRVEQHEHVSFVLRHHRTQYEVIRPVRWRGCMPKRAHDSVTSS